MLHPLFQRALAVGKQVLSQTPLAEGRVSVASVAVDYARRIFDRFDDKTVLSIGAGKMAALALRHFAAVSPGRLIVANRDAVKGQHWRAAPRRSRPLDAPGIAAGDGGHRADLHRRRGCDHHAPTI